MLATMAIEFVGALYVIFRYKLNNVGRLIAAILICLGVFQLAEYLICETIGLPGLTWARIGYVAITLLPPLGISLAMALAGKKSWQAQTGMYLACAAFIGYFAFAGNSLTGQICGGNYVIFTSEPGALLWYTAYYYGLLAISTTLCFVWAKAAKNAKTRKSLIALAIGYLAFIVPTVAVGLLSSDARQAIPSVMCGFAVLLAITLLAWVLPSSGLKRYNK